MDKKNFSLFWIAEDGNAKNYDVEKTPVYFSRESPEVPT